MGRNEATTRRELIDPMLEVCGWGYNKTEGSQVIAEHYFTDGQLIGAGQRGKRSFADYLLVHKNQKLAIIEAKKEDEEVTEGLGQVIDYAKKLNLRFVYSTNGHGIYLFDMQTGKGKEVKRYLEPAQLYDTVNSDLNSQQEEVLSEPYKTSAGRMPRYYQENAINATLKAITGGEDRVLLTLATGTGKTFIAFQIVWKLFNARWNRRGNNLRPRVLFLADRNVLIEQAMGDFNPLESDIVRVNGEAIRKRGKIPTNGNIFFSIYQAMTGGPAEKPFYTDYPKDFFDLVIIDECHRGAKEEGNWRAVLNHFSEATHLGLTATPKRKDNIDTYKYFGQPKYSYSLQEGIRDGFLTPFKVKRIETTMNEYRYTDDDEVLAGEVDKEVYEKKDFNRSIRIREREDHLVQLMLEQIDPTQKTIVFCVNERHALLVRDLVNEHKTNSHTDYCVRVTTSEGKIGDEHLRHFRDNDKTIPTIVTTSQKLSTGVDVRNVRFIVLMRSVGSMVEFKQIVGRGTRVFDGKDFFTIVDFNDNIGHFSDPAWDGEPIDDIEIEEPEPGTDAGAGTVEEPEPPYEPGDGTTIVDPPEPNKKLEIKLADGKVRKITHTVETIYFGPDGKTMSAREFLETVFGAMPQYFKTEQELRKIWSNPKTRARLLEELSNSGFDEDKLSSLKKIIDAQDSDMYDVLRYVAFAKEALSREYRADNINNSFFTELSEEEEAFVRFVLDKYEQAGERELSEENLPTLLKLKYQSTHDAVKALGDPSEIKSEYLSLQKELYAVDLR